MSTISGIIVAVVVACLMNSASKRFGEKFRIRMTESLVFGIGTGLVVAAAPKVSAIFAMVLLAPIIAMMVYLLLWWDMNGSTVVELITVAAVDIFLMLAGSSAAARILDLASTKWVVGLIRAIPTTIFLLSIGFYIFNMMVFREWLNSEEYDPDEVLDGTEKLSDFRKGNSLLKKIRRWVRDEEVA